MARYADYVKDDIVNEIEDASQNQQERKEQAPSGFEMPNRFQGKSPEEIAKSYVELEKLSSRQAQDLGSMRKTVDQLIDLQSRPPAEPPADSAESESVVDIDAIYENPERVISQVAEKAVGTRIKALESKLQDREKELALKAFEQKHGDWRETVQDPEFLNWVQENPFRTRLAQAADSYDFDAANDLFDLYGQHTGRAKNEVAEKTRQKQLQDATLESGTPASIDTEESFSRQNLLEARMAAKKGSAGARKWLADNSAAIQLAYEQGRVTD